MGMRTKYLNAFDSQIQICPQPLSELIAEFSMKAYQVKLHQNYLLLSFS
jgi:hypothetical protein